MVNEGTPDVGTDQATPDVAPSDVTPPGCTQDQCDIDGTCYANEEGNPENAYDVCSVLVDPTVWSANDAGQCDDDSLCTANDRCEDGQCVGDATPCNDGNLCTDESCDDATGQCVYTHNTAPCLSATPCNAAICDAGVGVQTNQPKDC